MTEYEKDKFKRKLKYSNKLEVVGDSKNDNMYYNQYDNQSCTLCT